MKAEYEPDNPEQAIAYLIEECGEVLAAAGKSLRWGLDSVNPELSPEEQESNRDWLLREMKDLAGAVKRVKAFIQRDSFENKENKKVGHCGLCGKPMPPGEEMFKFHGYSGPCPEEE